MNNSIIADYYEPLLTDNHFIPVDSNNRFNSAGQCWRLSPEFGEGLYWVYAKKDLYDIKIHDFYFHEDFFMEFNLPEALSITQYESISGEELNPYRRMSAGCIKAFIGLVWLITADKGADPQKNPPPFHRYRSHAGIL